MTIHRLFANPDVEGSLGDVSSTVVQLPIFLGRLFKLRARERFHKGLQKEKEPWLGAGDEV